MGNSIKVSTNAMMNKNSNIPTRYRFTFQRQMVSTSTLLIEDEQNKKMKDVMGKLLRTDVSGVFTVDRLTKLELEDGSKV